MITTYPWKGFSPDHSLLKAVPSCVKINRTKFFSAISLYQQVRKLVSQTPSGCHEDKATAAHSRSTQDGQNFLHDMLSRLKKSLLGLVSTPDHLVFWVFSVLAKGIEILLREKDIRFIMTTSPPHSSQLAGSLLSLIFNKPHIVDLRDPWNDIYWGDYSRFRSRFEVLLESIVISKAAKVISSTETYSQLLRNRFKNMKPDKFETITNSFQPDKFQRTHSKQNTRFTMCYLGIFYGMYEPYTFFTALAKWLDDFPEARPETEVIIVGAGDSTTTRVIDSCSLTDVVSITGRLPHEQAIQIAKSSDLLLLLLGVNEKVPPGCLPSKLFEYLACGKPILAHVPEGEAASVIRKTKTGYIVNSDNISEMVNIIKREYNRKKNKQPLPKHKFNPDQNEIWKYSSEYTTARLVKIFESIS